MPSIIFRTSEKELEDRLKRNRRAVRTETYDEKKHKRDKASRRKFARTLQKRAQEPFKMKIGYKVALTDFMRSEDAE